MSKRSFQDCLTESLHKFGFRIALQCEDRHITYSQLDSLSSGIAGIITAKVIAKKTFIGILVDDRIDFTAAMIAVIKTGCVFVPLDPALPDSRLVEMITAVDLKIVISDEDNLDRLAAITGPDAQTVLFQSLTTEAANGHLAPKPDISYSPEDKMYIFFTSGSTGKPKAILGKNKSLRHFIEWEIDTFGIDETFHCSQLTAPGFDAIMRDIFVPLCAGAVVCVPGTTDTMSSSAKLAIWLEKAAINVIHCVPFLFEVLNSGMLMKDNFKDLKYILLSGEKIEPTRLKDWYDIFGERVLLVNFYGPTETTMIKTSYLIRQSDIQRERIPIGKPMRGSRVIILDSRMKRCRKMIPGRLYIRTPFRTFGYLNEPELTAEKFIPNPFNSDPNDKLYDTGDIGKLLPDGNIDLLGREDRQVKIHGVRLELDEIEREALAYPGVTAAAAIKQEGKGHSQFLAAFITVDPGMEEEDIDIETALRNHLAQRLPAYALPARFLKIAELPRTPSGKVDYNELSHRLDQLDVLYEAPSTPMQETLLQAWAEILRMDPGNIGINHRFFELGGNSLNIMDLIATIHRTFDVRITLAEIFNNPTIRAQVDIIERASINLYDSIEPAPQKDYYPFSPPQKRVYIFQQRDAGSTTYNMTNTVLLEGQLDRGMLEEVFKQLIRRHESLRTSFDIIGGKGVQKVHNEVDFKVEYFNFPDQAASTSAPADIIESFIRPFDLAQPPLLRIGVIRLEKDAHILMSDIHHIVSDGSSIGILLNEFIALYNGGRLDPLLLQYKDYSQRMNTEEALRLLQEQENYWLDQLHLPLPLIELPYDFPRPDRLGDEGDTVYFQLDKEITTGLIKLTAEAGVTLFQLLLAQFNVLLAKICRQEDVIVGTVISGRKHADFRNSIGLFANTLVLRNFPASGKTFNGFLQEVKERLLAAFENQDYPFGDLVEKLPNKWSRNRNPVFDVQFQMEVPTEPDDPPRGLSLKRYGRDLKTVKLDLLVNVVFLGDVLLFSVDYKTALFKRETIDQLIGFFKRVITLTLHQPGIKLGAVEIMPKTRRERIVRDFNVELEYE